MKSREDKILFGLLITTLVLFVAFVFACGIKSIFFEQKEDNMENNKYQITEEQLREIYAEYPEKDTKSCMEKTLKGLECLESMYEEYWSGIDEDCSMLESVGDAIIILERLLKKEAQND